MSLNKVMLIGNLGDLPEIRATADGREIANFSLATSETWKDKATGEKKSKTEWHKVVVFSQGLVSIVKNGKENNWIKKGTKLYIEGQLQTRKWTDKNGVEKYITEIVLQNFNSTLEVLVQPPKLENQPMATVARVDNVKNEELDDDIPF